MDVGYSVHQISGPRVDNESVNQMRNVGGTVKGFVAEIISCEGKGVLLTTTTEPTLEALDVKLNALLERFKKA